jgi:hypothetical protein
MSAEIRRLLDQAEHDLNRAKGEISGPIDDRLIDVCESIIDVLRLALPVLPQEDPLENISRKITETIEGMPRLDMQTATPDDLEHAMGEWINLFDLQISLEPLLTQLRALPAQQEAQK